MASVWDYDHPWHLHNQHNQFSQFGRLGGEMYDPSVTRAEFDALKRDVLELGEMVASKPEAPAKTEPDDEITQAMLTAGTTVIEDYAESLPKFLLAAAVYHAMRRARPESPP